MTAFGYARQAGPLIWNCGEASYADGWIQLDPTRATTYAVAPHEDLVFELAAVRTPTDAIAFCRVYGLLRHAEGGESNRERFSDWETDALHLRNVIDWVINLRGALRGDDDAMARIKSFIRNAPVKPPPDLILLRDEDFLSVASSLVGAWVTAGLEGATCRLASMTEFSVVPDGTVRGGAGDFAVVINAANIVQIAYYGLAELLTRGGPMRGCTACGRYFPLDDPRRRFCSSTCAGRDRQRRYQASKKPPC